MPDVTLHMPGDRCRADRLFRSAIIQTILNEVEERRGGCVDLFIHADIYTEIYTCRQTDAQTPAQTGGRAPHLALYGNVA